MRAHYLQHVPFEGLGSIESWLLRAGYEITGTQLFASVELPDADDIDLLIILGGPMSVNDEQDHPWLALEQRFIKRVIEKGKPTLGICLGAQLVAKTMGGDVFPNAEKEIGWFPVQAVPSACDRIVQFPDEIVVFQWHGETFSLPPGAVLIAKSGACGNQAFQLGNNVIGLQFHLETTPDSAKALVENCGDELVEGRFLQTATEILSAPKEYYTSMNGLMVDLLTSLQSGSA